MQLLVGNPDFGYSCDKCSKPCFAVSAPSPDITQLLTDEEINYAFDNPVDTYFDHQPTQEEIFTLKLRAVEKAILAKYRERE